MAKTKASDKVQYGYVLYENSIFKEIHYWASTSWHNKGVTPVSKTEAELLLASGIARKCEGGCMEWVKSDVWPPL